LFFVAFNLSNVLNYAFLLAMSRALAPDDFALFAALFGAIYFASALANTAQTSVAAAVAAGDGTASAIVVGTARWLALMGLPLAVVVLAATRPVAAFLHSDDVASVALVGLAVWLLLLAAIGYGGLQGSGRFCLLGTGLMVASLGRLALGLYLVGLGLGVGGALLGVVIGLAASAALALAPFARRGPQPPSFASTSLPSLVLPALLASIAIAVPTSADVILARHYLPGPEAGAYAAVSVLGKVIIFVPMAVSLIAFPLVVSREAAGTPTAFLRRSSLLAAAGLAAPLAVAIVAAGAFFPGTVLRGYEVSVPFLVTYLAAMLAFSLVVVLLYSDLARLRHRYFVGMALPALAAELAVIALWHPTVLSMAVVVLAGNLLLLLVGLWLTWGGAEEWGRPGKARRAVAGRGDCDSLDLGAGRTIECT
jgi:O-antigen/teichoic acid export membrane protein